MKDLRVIILAAGKGTRMKSNVPKVLHPICGQPIIQYVLDNVKSFVSLKIYVILGHKSDAVKQYLDKDLIVIEQKKLLGTGDAVKYTLRYLKGFHGDVLILCGDAPLLSKTTLKSLVKKHKKTKAFCTFLTTVMHNPQGYGRIIREQNGSVVAIREDKDATGYEKNIAEINVGVYCFKSQELFKALNEIKINKKKREYYLTDIIELFSDKKIKIETLETEDPLEGLGINTREDLSKAESILRQRILKEYMDQGVTILDPHTTYIHSGVKIGKDTKIFPCTYIENNVRIGERCSIGPFARIRQGTKIANDVEVGNFTEISRSKIGKKSLLKHFSYIGDSFIGTNVNIGAGAVTANFDGIQKNTTRIADHASIGSDSVLVAPVKIGKNVIVGAGSVVTKGKSIPDGSTVVGIPARIISRRKRK